MMVGTLQKTSNSTSRFHQTKRNIWDTFASWSSKIEEMGGRRNQIYSYRRTNQIYSYSQLKPLQ